MKLSVAIGQEAKTTIERVIEDGIVVGVSIEGFVLTFDYAGLDADAALQRAVSNQTTVSDKIAELAEANELEAAAAYSYALGWFATGTTTLAHEQLGQAQNAPSPAPTEEVSTETKPPRRGRTQEAASTEA